MSDDARLTANWCKPIINEATGERVTWGGLRTLANVYCLDFEASSLSATGYPIEVGIADAASGEVRSWLIRPLPSWATGGHWDERAEAVHGISREQLERDGLPVAEVIDALNAVAYGGTILSDAPRHDNKWLTDLYRAGGYERATFAIDDLEAYSASLGERCGITSPAAMTRALHEAEAAFPGSHRAGPDARRNAEFLRLIAHAGACLNALALRSISYVDADGAGHTAFVAMTNAEFSAFQTTEPRSLKPYANRILYVLGVETPSEADCSAAVKIFGRRYGSKAIPW